MVTRAEYEFAESVVADATRCPDCKASMADARRIFRGGEVECRCGVTYNIAEQFVDKFDRLEPVAASPKEPAEEAAEEAAEEVEIVATSSRGLAVIRNVRKGTYHLVSGAVAQRLRTSRTCDGEPLVSLEALDAMERGWTPQQVRALIADYRRLAGYDHG